MAVNHRIVRILVAFAFGLLVAVGSFQWITDRDRSARRAEEEKIVLASRDILHRYVTDSELEISDAVDRVRAAGKVYLFPTDDGWELSGHYRRSNEKTWHAYLMSIDADANLVSLSVQDSNAELTARARSDPRLSTSE